MVVRWWDSGGKVVGRWRDDEGKVAGRWLKGGGGRWR